MIGYAVHFVLSVQIQQNILKIKKLGIILVFKQKSRTDQMLLNGSMA